MDGLWIDMNEPSNFCSGACQKDTSTIRRADPSVNYVHPPYSINNHGKRAPLNTKTIDMDALHASTVEYNVHNLYGKYNTLDL